MNGLATEVNDSAGLNFAKPLCNVEKNVTDIALSPGMTFVAILAGDFAVRRKTLVMCELSTAKTTLISSLHGKGLHPQIAFKSDRSLVCVCKYHNQGSEIVSFNAVTHNTASLAKDSVDLACTSEQARACSESALSPNGVLFAACNFQEELISLWDTGTGLKKYDICVKDHFQRAFATVSSLAISPKNDLVAFASENRVTVWDVETGRLKHEGDADTFGVEQICFSRDGRNIITGMQQKHRCLSVLRISPNSKQLTTSCKKLPWQCVGTVACSAGFALHPIRGDGRLSYSTFDKDDNQLFIQLAPNRHSNQVSAVAVSPCGKLAVTGDSEGLVGVWRLDSDFRWLKKHHPTYATAGMVVVVENGQFIGSCSVGKAFLYDHFTKNVIVSDSFQGIPRDPQLANNGTFSFVASLDSQRNIKFHNHCVDPAIPTDNNHQPMHIRKIMCKVAALRAFLAKNRNAPRQLLHSWCTHLDDAICDYAVERQVPSLKEQLDSVLHQFTTSGIMAALSVIHAPDNKCRHLLSSPDAYTQATQLDTTLHELADTVASLHNHVSAQSNNDNIQIALIPPYLEREYDRAIKCIESELESAHVALVTLDHPETHQHEEHTKASIATVLEKHNILLNPQSSSLVQQLQDQFPRRRVEERYGELQNEMRELMETIHNTVRDLNTFNQAAAAFQALIAANFSATVEGVEAKLNDLRTLHDELQDTYLDCDLKVRQLRRRSMGEQEREKLESSIVALRSESAKLRAQYRREHRLALKAVTRFFPELRSKLVDEKELSVSIPFFDPSMSMDCFTDLDRTYDIVQKGQLDGKPVAIKHFRMDQLPTFKRECKVYSAVQSSFVGEMLCAFQDDDGLVAVMPCYEGGTADTWADRHQDDAFLTVRLLRQAADGLKCLHRAGVTHCDFKPQNVVMTGKGPEALPKLIDFGCADVAETTTVLVNRMNTQTMHALTGFTPQYVAPEVTKQLTQMISPEAAEALRSLVTPALDIYAFGRWMSEVLKHPATWESSFVLDSPSDADGVVWAKMLQALQPFAPILTGLVNRSLSEDPSHRPAVGELAEMLYHIERELLKERDAKHVEESELLECSVCSAQVKRKECVACQTTTRREAQQHESHVYCRECLAVMLEDWRSKPVQKLADVNAKVTCSYGSCPGHLQVAAVVALVPEALDHVRFVERKTAEFVAIEEVKRRYENESLEQRAIREVEERILGLRCPKCRTSCVIGDFRNECLAMTCPRCDARFCGYCEQLCGDDAHHHVTSTHCSLGLFTTREKWYRYWYSRKEAELEKYLKSLPDDVGGKVRGRFPKPS